jgi:hypothetical protein
LFSRAAGIKVARAAGGNAWQKIFFWRRLILDRMIHFDRLWFQQRLARILSGWHKALKATSPSGAVWDSPRGIRTENFVSRRGKQCDGVTRMMPALAAWASQMDNTPEITLDSGEKISPRSLLREMFTHAFDPGHPDFWEYAPADRAQQRQVESSIVAWSLWLSRDWLLPLLSPVEIENIQKWLASCTQFSNHYNNWSLFTAVNHAARIALAGRGFSGDIEAVRRDLIPGEEVALGDGWLWDNRYHGIDYYNFWVWGSHHCYLKAMLPQYENPMLERSLRRFSDRLRNLPNMIDSRGQNVLFGRSLAYRWGWLSGAMVAQYSGIDGVEPGLLRRMFAKNLDCWLELGALNEDGVLRERLSPDGSDGARDGYINSGHPYWGMQAFLCLALPDSHAFWSAPLQLLPVEQQDFQIPCQGPGLVFQGFRDTGEVRLFNLRNLNHGGNALYQKFVYSTAFPCNCDSQKHASLMDNQFGLLLPGGVRCTPSDIMEADTFDGRVLRLAWRFKRAEFDAVIQTTLRVEGEFYQSAHEISVTGSVPEGAQWIEGGFPLGHRAAETPQGSTDDGSGWAELPGGERIVFSKNIAGWRELREFPDSGPGVLSSIKSAPNIIHGLARHFYLLAPVMAGRQRLVSQHGASLNSPRFKKLCGL